MFKLVHWLYRINKAYDKIQEPKRLFVLIALAMPGIIACEAFGPTEFIVGVVYLLTLLVMRQLYINGFMKSYIHKKIK